MGATNQLHLNLPDEVHALRNILNGKKGHSFPGHLNWNSFLKTAAHHRLLPVIHQTLLHWESSPVPAPIQAEIQRLTQQSMLRMLLLSGEICRITTACKQIELPFLFLKGPVLAQKLYGDLSLRISSDIDLLVPLEKLGQAELVLKEMGYEKTEYFSTLLNDWKWRHHHLTFYHPQSKVKVELHWRMHPGPGKEAAFENLWKRRGEITMGKVNVPMLGNEDLFVFLTLHGARHGWSRLRWLHDIHYLCAQELDWENVKKLLGPHLSNGAAALLLTECFFHTPLPKEVQQWHTSGKALKIAEKTLFYWQRLVQLHQEPMVQEVSEYHQKYLQLQMPLRQKILTLLSTLYPYPEDTECLPLPKKLSFFYFPMRPFLWGYRKTLNSRNQAGRGTL